MDRINSFTSPLDQNLSTAFRSGLVSIQRVGGRLVQFINEIPKHMQANRNVAFATYLVVNAIGLTVINLVANQFDTFHKQPAAVDEKGQPKERSLTNLLANTAFAGFSTLAGNYAFSKLTHYELSRLVLALLTLGGIAFRLASLKQPPVGAPVVQNTAPVITDDSKNKAPAKNAAAKSEKYNKNGQANSDAKNTSSTGNSTPVKTPAAPTGNTSKPVDATPTPAAPASKGTSAPENKGPVPVTTPSTAPVKNDEKAAEQKAAPVITPAPTDPIPTDPIPTDPAASAETQKNEPTTPPSDGSSAPAPTPADSSSTPTPAPTDDSKATTTPSSDSSSAPAPASDSNTSTPALADGSANAKPAPAAADESVDSKDKADAENTDAPNTFDWTSVTSESVAQKIIDDVSAEDENKAVSDEVLNEDLKKPSKTQHSKPGNKYVAKFNARETLRNSENELALAIADKNETSLQTAMTAYRANYIAFAQAHHNWKMSSVEKK